MIEQKKISPTTLFVIIILIASVIHTAVLHRKISKLRQENKTELQRQYDSLNYHIQRIQTERDSLKLERGFWNRNKDSLLSTIRFLDSVNRKRNAKYEETRNHIINSSSYDVARILSRY